MEGAKMEGARFEDAFTIAIQHLEGASLGVRVAVMERFERILFPHEDEDFP